MMARRSSYQNVKSEWRNDCWTVRYRELDHQTGVWKQRRKRLEGCNDKNNKKAAKSAVDAFMAQVNERNNTPQKRQERLTFKPFIEGRWAAYVVKEQMKDSTQEVNNSMIRKHLLPFFGDMVMSEITPDDVTRFLSPFYRKPNPSYAKNLYLLLSSVFSVADEYDDIPNNPVRPKVHKPKLKQKPKPTLPVDVHIAVIKQVALEFRMLFAFVSVTGLRIGEVLRLRWSDIDFDAGLFCVTHTLWRRKLYSPKSETSIRRFKIPAYLRSVLLAQNAQSRFTAPTDFVFCRSDGSPYDADQLRNKVLYPALDALGIERAPREHGFHLLRHSMASLGYELTKDSVAVQHALGHADDSTTKAHYIHISQESGSRVLEAVADRILSHCDTLFIQESAVVN
jgi:integrase